MAASKIITIHGYKIFVEARQYLDGYWVGGYKIARDGWSIRASKSVTFHASEAAAEASALAMGIQYVNECLLPAASSPSKSIRNRR